MPINYPQFDELVEQIIFEFRQQLPDIDPTVKGSWANGFVVGTAIMAQALSLNIRDLETQLFPQFAIEDLLDRWGSYEGLTRLTTSESEGKISVTGTLSTFIPQFTQLTKNEITYETQVGASIATKNQSIVSITRIGGIATVVTNGEHELATPQSVTISGANETDYNGTFEITVIDSTTFTYTVPGSPTTPATGTIAVATDYASISVKSIETGTSTNQNPSAVLTFVSTPSGADNDAIVQVPGLVGGAAQETDEAYRERILLSRSIIQGVFTTDQILLSALSIVGNTRVFIINPEDSVCDGAAPAPGFTPSPGQVAIYILRDNDPNIIPSQIILDQTKQAIISNGRLPAHVSEIDVFVLAPVPLEVDFAFSSINPDTPTMRTAIENQLTAFFEDSVDFQTDIPETSYTASIQNTRDTQTGEFLQTFSLTSPTGLISVANGEIAIRGTVTF